MKRIKAMNGYTIYQYTARDEKQGEGIEGEYAIYFSSDIKDYGREYSTAEYDGLGSMDECLECIADGKFYALARTELESECTAITFDMIIEREAILRKESEIEAGNKNIALFDIVRDGDVEICDTDIDVVAHISYDPDDLNDDFNV